MDYTGNIINKNPPQPTQASAPGVWTLSEAAAAVKNNSWPIVGVPNPISKSLRFNSADSAYLNRSFASSGNRKTWTWSCWFKKVPRTSETYTYIFDCSDYATNTARINAVENSTDSFSFNDSSISLELVTTAVYRDPSAWYHIVVVLDTTQATSSNRAKIYVNGTQVTALSTATYPSQNADGLINYVGGSFLHKIGTYNGSTSFFNGYMTEINFIDGQALTPSDFGMTDTATGVWIPKKYTGTYGGNGFYLNFKDSASTTTIGYDYSGNGNNWTANNFSVTAGAGNDSLTDVPTPWVGYSATNADSGGIVRGNYCTLNPLSTTTGTYSQGNLRFVGANSGKQSNGTIAVSTGKWYWEVTLASAPFSPRASNSDWSSFGFSLSTVFDGAFIVNSSNAVVLADSGYYKNFSGSATDAGTAFSSGDVLAIAVDLDANTFTFYRNNSQLVTGTIGGTAGRELVPCQSSYSSAYGLMDCNFGQRPFAYTPPSGYKSLVTTNLPTPPNNIGATATTQANDYFNTVLYTGTGSSLGVTGVGFQPDFVWIKERAGAADHGLYDAVRGVQKQLESNNTDAETTETTGLTAFNTDGFTVGALAQLNTNTDTYVAWNWKANGAGSSNNAGTITSTVSANTTAGFSIVTYTGNGTSGATVGHGLGATPRMMIFKQRGGTTSWPVYHSSLTSANYALFLNLTIAEDGPNTAYFNNTAPTSTLFTLGNLAGINGSGNTFVAYCFAPVAGYSAFGSYVGTGTSDGPFVYTGFRPAFILVKVTSTTGYDWYLMDAKRPGYNVISNRLFPNLDIAEATTGDAQLDFLSNGFKLRSGNSNAAQTYIYAAFAEFPFKYSLAR